MKIYSQDKNSWLKITKNEGEYDVEGTYSIEVKFDIGHSVFNATNKEVIFTNGAEFKSTLNEFVMNRDLCPKLEGTYDSYVSFKAVGNNVVLSVNVGSAFCSSSTFAYSTSGEFEVSQEYLTNIVGSLPF